MCGVLAECHAPIIDIVAKIIVTSAERVYGPEQATHPGIVARKTIMHADGNKGQLARISSGSGQVSLAGLVFLLVGQPLTPC